MLEIRHLKKVYANTTVAVDDLTLTVEAGDIYGFIGQNGAGKTTTLRSVAGILDFDGGEILIDGHSIQKEPIAAKKLLAYIPDNPDLYEFLSGIGFLNFIADVYGVPVNEREACIEHYADSFEMRAHLNSQIASYSHGMKQKIAIMGALIHKPRLLLLDEPFVGLDPKASFTLKNIMRELCGEGCAIFFSTHVLEVAEKLCNKVAIIKGGKLVSNGSMEEVRGDSSLESIFLELTEQ